MKPQPMYIDEAINLLLLAEELVSQEAYDAIVDSLCSYYGTEVFAEILNRRADRARPARSEFT